MAVSQLLHVTRHLELEQSYGGKKGVSSNILDSSLCSFLGAGHLMTELEQFLKEDLIQWEVLDPPPEK